MSDTGEQFVEDLPGRQEGSHKHAGPDRNGATPYPETGPNGDRDKLLSTLEQLLAIDGTDVNSALVQASNLIARSLGADKVDAFIYDPAIASLVVFGVSDTPMGRRQREIGMDRLPVANGGRMVEVYQTGRSYITGEAKKDREVLPGFTEGLGIQSIVAAPIYVAGERRGVLHAASTKLNLFRPGDLRFLEAAANWIGTLTHRAELSQRITEDAITQARQVAADELITILAHDLGNYITPLKGRLDLLRRRARREAREHDLRDANEALTAIERLQGLINDLLDAGRLEQGIFSISPEPLDLAGLVSDTVEVMATNRHKIVLHAPEEVTLEADRTKVRQALENLISNAVKHSPPGLPIDVEVRCETRADGDWAIITVRDQGPGIPAQLLPRLFTRFASGPNSSGLGLGLYLARSIVEAHGGTLTVDTAPAKGTAFQMSLPATGAER